MHLPRTMQLWNAVMTLFSMWMAWLLVPLLFDEIRSHDSLTEQLCDSTPYVTDARTWAVFVFNVTKIFEWVDTVMLVVRKKPIILLHWYHHLATMLYCWHGNWFSAKNDASGIWFSGMNVVVHSIMYGYYWWRSVGGTTPPGFSKYITLGQTLQM